MMSGARDPAPPAWRLDEDEALLWLFSAAALVGTPPPGRMSLVSPAFGYGRHLSYDWGWRPFLPPTAGAQHGPALPPAFEELVRAFGSVDRDVLGVLLPRDAWPPMRLPGDPPEDPLDQTRPWYKPTPRYLGDPELFLDPHPLSCALVRSRVAWAGPREGLRRIVTGLAAAFADAEGR